MLGEALCNFFNDIKPKTIKPLKSSGPLTDLYNIRQFATNCDQLGVTITPEQINIHTIKQVLIPLFDYYKLGNPISKLDEKINSVKTEDNKTRDLTLVIEAILKRLEKIENGISRLPSNITVMQSLEDFVKEEPQINSKAFEEFVKTEKDYCQDLCTFELVYITEIRNRHLLHPNVLGDLEEFIKNLIEFSNSLVKLLEERQTLECLDEIDTESFEIFKEYSNNFVEVSRVLDILKNKSENREFFELWRKPEAKGQPVESYLIKPIQRICRYPLILKEYAKDLPDSKSIYSIIESLQKYITHINEITIGTTDDKRKYSIQNKLKDSVIIFNLDRF
eukprot:NODE_95_length_21511_cov_0.501168.p8 type:complete len:335 gc:universal NODE_95_length_21511_cov_0.501168:9510-10514(+)